MKPWLLFLFLCFGLSSFAQQTETYFFDATYKPVKKEADAVYKATIEKTIIYGEWHIRVYYPGGALMQDYGYTDFFKGMRTDTAKIFYESGKLKKYFVFSKYTAVARSFYESGRIRAVEHFKNDVHADSTTYYEENGLISSVEYHNASGMVNRSVLYNEAGVPYMEVIYGKDRSEISRKYFDNTVSVAGGGEVSSTIPPVFPGGEIALYTWLGENIKYPKKARTRSIQGKVYIHFTVKANGSITDEEISMPLHPMLDFEVMSKVIVMPVWQPGEMDGEKVNVMYTLPVAFKLED